MRQWYGIVASLLIFLMTPRAMAQTTQPAPEAWGQTVQAIAGALVGSEPSTALGAILPEEAPLREFHSTRSESRQRLAQRAEGMQIISSRAYVWAATTIASDLASDIKICDSLPPSLRAPFIPRDEAESRKANTIAQQWVNSVLEPAAGDLVGVIMLWEPPATATSLLLSTTPLPEPRQPLFVFIKCKQESNGELKITSLCFGDARQALK